MRNGRARCRRVCGLCVVGDAMCTVELQVCGVCVFRVLTDDVEAGELGLDAGLFACFSFVGQSLAASEGKWRWRWFRRFQPVEEDKGLSCVRVVGRQKGDKDVQERGRGWTKALQSEGRFNQVR